MSQTPTPGPALPPGKPREELLRYFQECWPRGQRIASVKYKDWTPEVDRQREREDADEDDDERGDGSVAEAPRRLPPQGPGVEFREVASCDKTVSVLICEMTAAKWEQHRDQLPGTWVVVKKNGHRLTAVRLR
jgi:hypothetical protein